MNNQRYRIDKGGLIDRSKPLNFEFNGKSYQGFMGDTLASALLANGVHLIGRSFKYHRPRGIVASGIEEPNALIQLETEEYTEPNLQSTRIILYDGLIANSQNCWPSVTFDLMAINTKFHKLIPAGFYYKTFMWPKKLWLFYESIIRKIAGIGVAPQKDDPDTYEHQHAHCDILIVGGGPAGIAAALQAVKTNARIILVDSDPTLGGYLRVEKKKINGKPALDWVANATKVFRDKANIIVLNKTIVSSYYDHNMLILNQHLDSANKTKPRQRLWQVRAKEVILATGSIERPIVFSNNDHPGIMLMSAVLSYASIYAVRAGTRAVIFTNNNSVYASLPDLISSGINVVAIIDVREIIPKKYMEIASNYKIKIFNRHVVYNVKGSFKITSVQISTIGPDKRKLVGNDLTINCDLLCVSGGWTPSVHLFSQSQGKLRYDSELTAFVPHKSVLPQQSIGSCNGKFSLIDCINEGFKAGLQATKQLNFKSDISTISEYSKDSPLAIEALWSVPSRSNDKKFVDFQNDVTSDDIALAHRENYISVEHLKRYTTLGMGTDQGRLSNVNGLAIMAELRNLEIQKVGTTTFRPPFSPITMGAVAGYETNEHFIPIRLSSMHENHKVLKTKFVRAGQWLRPQCYPKPNETIWDTISREALHVRQSVGIVDVSTLGKIDLKGSDAAEFLNRIYVNNFKKLPVGKCRYGVMLREDGMVFDDGTVTRINENHFLITTTTLKAAAVLQHMEFFAQVEWPNLDLHMLSVTEEWSAIAIAGPDSRNILSSIINNIDLSNETCPFMAFREGTILNIPVRIFRISFSGELAYEINIPANYGPDVWELILKVGESANIKPYGTEAMNVLRIEKGHAVGSEINGRTSAEDLGFSSMMSSSADFIGKRASQRPGLKDSSRSQLVGLKPIDRKAKIPRAGRIVNNESTSSTLGSEGEITSLCFSPTLGHHIALALIASGRSRIGEIVKVVSPLSSESIEAEICNSIFFDPNGERLRG